MTTFLTIFRRFPTTFRRFFKIVPKVRRTFFGDFPKITEDFLGGTDDVSIIQQQIYFLRDYGTIALVIILVTMVTITTVISSHVKITCYLHVWRYEVFAGKLTWYFTGVYVIKSNSKQKTSPQSYKTQINILPFPGLAQTGTEQLGQGATLFGWPKSIY